MQNPLGYGCDNCGMVQDENKDSDVVAEIEIIGNKKSLIGGTGIFCRSRNERVYREVTIGCAIADYIKVSYSTGIVSGYEQKVSQADFNADFKKHHQQKPIIDSVHYFYYLMPYDIITVDILKKIPQNAGLVIFGNGTKIIKKPKKNLQAKMPLLLAYNLFHKMQLNDARNGVIQ